MESERDTEQDLLIRSNAERITRNEEAIKRQTEALEKIRDHYYPPAPSLWKRTGGFMIKVLCVVLAYAGGVQAVDWYINVRKSAAMAAKCASVAQRLFLEEGNATGAAQYYERAIELDDGTVAYRTAYSFMKGAITVAGLFDAGRPLTAEEQARVDAALAEASMLKELEPDDPLPEVLMAQAYLARGDKASAVEAVERAVASAPNKAAIRISACAIYSFAGQPDVAQKYLDEAERLDATLPLLPYWRGMLALAKKNVAKAVEFLEVAQQRMPRQAIVYAMLGKVLLVGEKCDIERAEKEFQRALALNPQMKLAMLGMAEVAERKNIHQVAKIWLGQVLSLDEHSLAALLARARINVKLREYDAAIDDITAAITLAPFRADLYRERAEVYGKKGDAAKRAADLKVTEELTSRSSSNAKSK